MRWMRSFGAGGAVLLSAMTLAACGSDDDSGSTASSGSTSAASGSGGGGAGKEAAAAAVQRAMGVPRFIAPGPRFDASRARGMTVALVPDYPALPFVQEINSGLREAAAAAGVTLKDCQNNGTVGDWVRCFDQAILSRPDLILLNGSPSPSQLQPQIRAAERAGIPVVANHVPLDDEFPEGTLPDTNTAGLTGVQAGPFTEASRLMADYAIANTDGPVHALIVTADEAPASRGMTRMIQDEISTNCEDCSSKVINVPIVDWGTRLQNEVRTALLADPRLNWVIPLYDGAYQFALPGVQASGRGDSIGTMSFNGQGVALDAIARGTATATAGENLNWTGWSTMDQVLRILATGRANEVRTADTPIRIWDRSNIADAGDPPRPTVGYGEEYRDGYLDLWGLGG